MKKLLIPGLLVAILASCGESQVKTEAEPNVTVTPQPEMVVEETYAVTDGDVTFKEGKVLVFKDGAWVVAEKDIALDDGTVITVKGDVKSADGKIITLKEGETVSKVGKFFDRTGKAITNAWDATKEGVENAAEAAKDKAEQIGDAAKTRLKKQEKQLRKVPKM